MQRKSTYGAVIVLIFLTCLPIKVSAQSGVWVQLYETAQTDIKQSHWADAEFSLRRAIPIAEGLGQSDVRYALTLGSLGRVYVAQERYTEAEELLVKAVDLLQKADYKEQELAEFCLSYQDLLIKTGRKDDALQVNDAIKQMVAQKVSLQKQLTDPWQSEFNAGMSEYAARNFKECEPHLLKSLEIAKTQIGEINEVRKSMSALFSLYREQRRYALVDLYFPKLQSLLVQSRGAHSTVIASLYSEYAHILKQQNRNIESAEFKFKANALFKEISEREKKSSEIKFASNNSHFFSEPLSNSWNIGSPFSGSEDFLNTQAETMHESYLREADIVAQTERNTRALESRQLQLEVLHPNYMSRYYRH